ncbi:MlaD family protein [Thermodesulfobacteriota bacterium]
MPGQTDKFKIGLFVVVSFLLFMAMILWLGASHIFKGSQSVVAFFTESVQGLETDSPVKFRGVNVGRVHDIRMAPDAKSIEVVMRLDENFKITDDLGVKMGMLGLTGQKYLEMDRYKPGKRKDPPTLDFEPKYPMVTAYPSDMREIGSAFDSLYQKINTVDIEAIGNHLLKVSGKLDKILDDPKLDDLGKDTAESVRNIREAAETINSEVKKLQFARRTGKTLDKASELLNEVSKTTRTANKFLRRTDNNVNLLSQKFGRAADSVTDVATMLRNDPRSIFFGAKDKNKK